MSWALHSHKKGHWKGFAKSKGGYLRKCPSCRNAEQWEFDCNTLNRASRILPSGCDNACHLLTCREKLKPIQSRAILGYLFGALCLARAVCVNGCRRLPSQVAVGLAMSSLPLGDKAVCTLSVTRGSHKTLGRLLTVESWNCLKTAGSVCSQTHWYYLISGGIYCTAQGAEKGVVKKEEKKKANK